jgi:hypothetical protein
METIHAQTANYAETLILEPGDDIAGKYQRLERGHTRDGDARAIAVIEVGGTERSLWLHETALRGQFRELKPEPDELVRIQKGSEKKKSGNGFNYWPFRVTAPDRPVETVSWDSPLLGDDDELAATTSEPDVPIDTSEVTVVEADSADIPF